MRDQTLQPVMISKRANIFYIEHAKVVRSEDTVMFLTKDMNSRGLFFNIPEKNTSLLLLGTGTSITNAAAQKLAEANVIVGFCGSRGFPLYSTTDISFLSTQSQYRPTEYMQKYIRLWLDLDFRLLMAKDLILTRTDITFKAWGANEELQLRKIKIDQEVVDKFKKEVNLCGSSQELLLTEARFAKGLFARLAAVYTPGVFRREYKPGTAGVSDIINNLLNHGNYIAYGCSTVALNGLGISFAFPLLHGETRRGALVFDIADLFKDAYVMPLAFKCGAEGITHKNFRHELIDLFFQENILDMLFMYLESVIEKFHLKQQDKDA